MSVDLLTLETCHESVIRVGPTRAINSPAAIRDFIKVVSLRLLLQYRANWGRDCFSRLRSVVAISHLCVTQRRFLLVDKFAIAGEWKQQPALTVS